MFGKLFYVATASESQKTAYSSHFLDLARRLQYLFQRNQQAKIMTHTIPVPTQQSAPRTTRSLLDRATTASVAAMLAMALFALTQQMAASHDQAAQLGANQTLTSHVMA